MRGRAHCICLYLPVVLLPSQLAVGRVVVLWFFDFICSTILRYAPCAPPADLP